MKPYQVLDLLYNLTMGFKPGNTTSVMVTQLKQKKQVRFKEPSRHRVILLNDDYTPMDFVVHLLEKIFHMPKQDATKLMMEIHLTGSGVCGVFAYEVAEMRVSQVNLYARKHNYPLVCKMEQE